VNPGGLTLEMANNRLINFLLSNCVGLIYVAISPPSIVTAFGFPPSTLAVEFCYSETKACSWCMAYKKGVGGEIVYCAIVVQ